MKQIIKNLLLVTILCSGLITHQTNHAFNNYHLKKALFSVGGCALGGLLTKLAAPGVSKEFLIPFVAHSTALIFPEVLQSFTKNELVSGDIMLTVISLQMITPLYHFLQYAKAYIKNDTLKEVDKAHLKNGIRQLIAIFAARGCTFFGNVIFRFF